MSIFSDAKVSRLTLVAALGYFVDIYDLLLFNVVKKASLASLGIVGLSYEASLANWQMFGMLLGGIFWGILGDKRGRVTVLFGSILLYSVANIANAFVTTYEMYAVWRFIAGLGLAGELGAGITLVSETMDKENRGIGTMIIVSFGVLGAVVAAFVGQMMGWQNAFIVGGVMGLALLALRAGALESGMFEQIKKIDHVEKGNFFRLFNNGPRLVKYLRVILIGLPIWFIIGILIAFSDRFGKMAGIAEPIVIGTSVMFCYLGLSSGDLCSGILSQVLRSRKKVMILFQSMMLVVVLIYLFVPNSNMIVFNTLCFLLGFSAGYWALFVQNASEQFGTNLRSTVTNTAPNFVRGALVPMTLSFQALLPNGLRNAALIVGLVAIAIAFLSTISVEETFGKELDYLEE
jgi:MFS family permease